MPAISQESESVPGVWGRYKPDVAARLLIGLSRKTPLGRGASRRAVADILKARCPGPIDTRLWGMPVRLHPWNNACEYKALLRPDLMDPAEHAFVIRTMAAKPSVFVDVGANAGLYSLHAAISTPDGSSVLAIEPNPTLIERFELNVRLGRKSGRISPGVTIWTANAAVSDHDGEGFLSSERKEGIRRLVSQSTENPVRVFRLETLLAEHRINRIDLMKIDIEGHEDRVLPGFFATSPQPLWPRSIILEHLSRGQWAVDCIEACVARGYRIDLTTRQNSILSR